MNKNLIMVAAALFAGTAAFGEATEKQEPFFRFVSAGEYLETGKTALPYEALEVTNVTVRIYRAYGNNLALYGKGSWNDVSRMARIAEKELTLPPPYGEKRAGMLSLESILGGQPANGGWLVEVEGPCVKVARPWGEETQTITAKRSFRIGNLGAVAFFDETGNSISAAVHSLADGASISGAKVTALSYANQVAGEAVTGEDGTARIDFIPAFDAKRDWVKRIIVETASDATSLDFDNANCERDSEVGSWRFNSPRAFLWAARDIVRPGETMEIAALVRNSIASGNKPIKAAPVDFTLTDPRGNSCGRIRVKTDSSGHASCVWQLPLNAPTGSWTVDLESGGENAGSFFFTVAAYQPDRIKATLKSECDAVTGVSTPIGFSWGARYYFGQNAYLGTWNCRVVGRRADAPKHWQGWTCDFSLAKPSCETIEEFFIKGSLGEEKREFVLPPLNSLTREDVAPVRFSAALNVVAEGERAVTAWTETTVFPREWYFGCRKAEGAPSNVHRFEFAALPSLEKAALVAPEGGTDATIRLVRCEWRRVFERDSRGVMRAHWEETEIPAPELDLAFSIPAGTSLDSWRGVAEWPIESLKPGRWILRVVENGKAVSAMDFWHSAGEVSVRSVSPAGLDFVADKNKYLPGETARIKFKSPAAGLAHIAAGWRGVELARTMEVKGGENEFELSIPDDVIGTGYYAEVVLVTRDAPTMRRLAGRIKLSIDQAKAHRLDVKVETEDVTTPNATSKVKVSVADSSGNGRKAKVRVMATDMGVLALTDFATPNPYAHIHGFAYGLPFGVYDLYSSIYPDIKILPNGEFGGDMLMAAMAKKMAARQRDDGTIKEKETVALMLGVVETDENGEAEIELPGVDLTGALRVMAVAWDDEAEGSGSGSLTVREKISARVLAPRFAVAGDKFEISAVAFDNDLPCADYRFALEWPDGSVAFEGVLDAESETNFFVRVELPEDAAGNWEIRARMEAEGIACEDTARVLVRPAHGAETEIVYCDNPADLPAIETEWTDCDQEISECSSPASTLSNALDWLDEYPYGCLEQVCAKAFPFLAADELAELGLIDEKTRDGARERVRLASAEIQAMVRGSGGFGMWPWSDETWRAGSLFAWHFLAEAAEKGYIEKTELGRGVRYLRQVAADASKENLLSAAYASYILAAMNEESFLVPARNLALAGQNDDGVRFLAAAALVRGGRKSEGEAILLETLSRRFWGKTEVSPLGGGRARELGQVLFIAARLGVPGETLSPLVFELNGLIRTDERAWGTTSDNAWAAAGLATAVAHAGIEDEPVFKVTRIGVRRIPSPPRSAIKLSRRIVDRDGNEKNSFERGDLARMEIELESPRDVESAVIAALVPAGFEIEDQSLKTRERATGKTAANDGFSVPYGRSDIRDDRWLWFGSLYKGEKYRLSFNLRAVTRGEFAVPGVSVEDMYDPDLAGDAPLGGEVSVK